MSFKTCVKLDSKIFDSPELRRALAGVPLQAAKDFAKDLGGKMENSPHTGTVVTKARGGDFRVRHQQSRRGERPAPFTKELIRSIKAKKTGEFTALVDSDAPYVNKLIFDDGRVLVTGDDLEEAKQNQQKLANEIIRAFL